MNIIHFTDTYYPMVNGVSAAVEQFALQMAKDNNVLIVCPSCSFRTTLEKKGNITFKRIRSVSFPVYPGVQAAVPNIISLYKLVKEFKPDIIHIHTPFILGILGVIFAQIFGVKLVNTYHTLFSSTTMYLSPKRFLPGQNLSLKPKNEDLSVVQQITWRLQIIFFNLADTVIAPTKTIEKTLLTQGIKTRTKVIPSGINTELFSCKSDFSKKNRILHLGRLGLEKSTDVVIQAFAELHKVRPDVELIMVGDGPAKKSLEKLAKDLGVKEQVQFMGMIDHNKTPEIFQSCDLFVTASTMETQGLVILEAMLSGLPVVAAAVNAPVDLIKDGYNGYLFPENDAKACALRMLAVLNEENIAQMSKNCRTFAESFDSELLSKELLTHYQELVSRPS